MTQHGVGQTQIAFRVFKVNRVHLVWHGGRTDLAFFEALLEVTQGDVAPNVTVEVQQNGVGAGNRVKQGSHPVMRFDLNGVDVLRQAQTIQHLLAEGWPVNFGVSREVRIVVTGCTVQFSQRLNSGDGANGVLQAGGHVGELFAHGAGAGRLTVGAREQRLLGMQTGLGLDGITHFLQLGQDDLLASTRQHQGVRSVVDVFRGAGEVDELSRCGQLGVVGHFFFQPVFHGFHVVVGGALDGLDAGGIVFREVLHQALEHLAGLGGESRQFRQTRVGQADQPGHFDLHAMPHKCGFGQQATQGGGTAAITPVQWRQGIQSAQGIGYVHRSTEKKGE